MVAIFTGMTTLARESRASRVAFGESRATLRRPVKLRARLRDRSAVRFDITVIDLSTTGFRAETAFAVRPGALVWITLPGLAGLEAEIAWQRGEQLGARFRQPLHAAVFQHIVDLGR